jgi:hypothetical protein
MYAKDHSNEPDQKHQLMCQLIQPLVRSVADTITLTRRVNAHPIYGSFHHHERLRNQRRSLKAYFANLAKNSPKIRSQVVKVLRRSRMQGRTESRQMLAGQRSAAGW